jgi:hypothetical protein
MFGSIAHAELSDGDGRLWFYSGCHCVHRPPERKVTPPGTIIMLSEEEKCVEIAVRVFFRIPVSPSRNPRP